MFVKDLTCFNYVHSTKKVNSEKSASNQFFLLYLTPNARLFERFLNYFNFIITVSGKYLFLGYSLMPAFLNPHFSYAAIALVLVGLTSK